MKILTSMKIILFAFILVFLNACGEGMKIFFEDQALDANTSIVNYFVTYDANGGSGNSPLDTNGYLENASVTALDHGALTLNGYTFECWNTQSDGNGTDIIESSTFTMGASDGKYEFLRCVTASANFSTDSNLTPSANEANLSF